MRVIRTVAIWVAWVEVAIRLRRQPLPAVVVSLSRRREPGIGRLLAPPGEPRTLSRLIWRRLRFGRWRPVCLPRALVLYRLLRARGIPAELVIGLVADPRDQAAHAWVEVDGLDVGPPPGQDGHLELVRYPLAPSPQS